MVDATKLSTESSNRASAMNASTDLEKVPSAQDGGASSTDGLIDIKAERRLVRKIDLCVFPVLFLIYMLSFLDRINISNARIQGLTAELELHGSQFNIALFVYFIPYILLEVPSNMIIRKVRPSRYLAGLMFAWGVINMCMGFVHTYGALVALRFLLGACEAGVLPGIIYVTSMYYKRHEFQLRVSFLFSSTLVGGAFGGLLAYAIAHLGGANGYEAWRWTFIIEGAATAFVALCSYPFLVDWPEQSRFLNTGEKALLQRRIADDGCEFARMDTLNRFAYKTIFSDWKIWLGSLIYMGIGTTGYAVTFFMPTILLEFGWKAEEAQVRTIPVYIVSAVGMLLVAYLSDKVRHRYAFIMGGCCISTIGYGMLLRQDNLSRGTKFAAMFFVPLGGNIATPIALAWLSNNLSGHWKRAFGSGLQVMLGNFAGVVGANIFLPDESPSYPTGYTVALGMLWLGGLAATAMFIGLLVENRKRNAGKRDSRLHPAEINNMGDGHPSFRFTL